ncbi:hypothetical protein MRB53_039463 [Persea americana]|nr:hypothetical protein MRB53_039463 [Persea americana]
MVFLDRKTGLQLPGPRSRGQCLGDQLLPSVKRIAYADNAASSGPAVVTERSRILSRIDAVTRYKSCRLRIRARTFVAIQIQWCRKRIHTACRAGVSQSGVDYIVNANLTRFIITLVLEILHARYEETAVSITGLVSQCKLSACHRKVAPCESSVSCEML